MYTLSDKPRTFEFIDHKKRNIILTGNMRQYREQPPSNEIKQFDSMKIKNLPNSKRTIIPHMNNEEQSDINHIKKSQFGDRFNEGFLLNNFTPIQGEVIPNQRKSASKIYKETSEENRKKELRSNNYHEKYVINSQINALPGPRIVKRQENEYDINTGNKYMIYYNNNNETYKENLDLNNGDKIYTDEINRYERKIKQNYNTNIACLPGCRLNQKEKEKSLVSNNKLKNESHFTLGINYNNNLKEENFNTNENFNNKTLPRPRNFSSIKIPINNKETNRLNNNTIKRKKIFRTNSHSNISNMDKNYVPIDNKVRYSGLNVSYKNHSQIILG